MLAFVFIPISLASSIFGMNVQEINDTGHSIWTFVITVMVMLLASSGVWKWRHTLRILFKKIRSWPYDSIAFPVNIAGFVHSVVRMNKYVKKELRQGSAA